MLRRFSVDFAIFSMALDAALTLLVLRGAALLRSQLPAFLPGLQPLRALYLPTHLYFLAPLLWVLILLVVSAYDPRRTYRAADEFGRVGFGSLLASLCFAGLLYLTEREVSRGLFVLFILLNFVLLLGWRMMARLVWKVVKAPPARRRVLIAGAGEVGQRVAQEIQQYAWAGLELVGFLDDDPAKRDCDLPVLGTLDDATRVVQEHGVEDVVIALPRRAHARLDQLVQALHELPVHVYVVPDYFALALYRASVEDFAGIPMINLRAPALNDYQRLVKRAFDLVVGSILTLLALPVMGLVALAIKLDSPGPILFRQQRVGENGRLFTMYKFRSMVVNAEALQDQVTEVREDGTIIHKKPDDPRVTRVGRFIRRYSLDELPQLFNVLKGDMSLVGPRPELPWLVERYQPWQRKRFAVPQGITGWWQVNGRSDKPMHLHTEEDLFYIQNYSLWLDLVILWKTIWVVLRGRGAY
ncbi:undecaprenyl-phosphate glucose phosphotransferase [Thermoflexus sp.]|uniref:undecaprenyl-phosphate glucose phosphotransferase n=1 Tax=Thermoflexus sp. TaxID=1969742 RepID=UPI0035E426AD